MRNKNIMILRILMIMQEEKKIIILALIQGEMIIEAQKYQLFLIKQMIIRALDNIFLSIINQNKNYLIVLI
jgi:hypothetical protein